MSTLIMENDQAILSQDAQARIAGLESLLEVTKVLAAEKDLERLLELIIQQACQTLRCERASLFLYDEERQELYTRKVTRLEGIQEIRLSREQGIVGLAARERRVVQVQDPYNHPLFNAHFDRCTQFRTRNILCAPLISWGEDKLLGVLQLLNRQDEEFAAADQRLLDAFAAHAAIAIDRAILARHYEEKMRMMVSLEVARAVQAGFFPRQLPQLSGYEMAATSRPADATGGDYYDAIPLPSGQLGLVVADVCGHGLGPSLLMASVRAILKGLAVREPSPESLVTDLGMALYDDLCPQHRFITLLYGSLDTNEHCFRYANAGHGPIVLHYQAAEGRFRTLVDDGCHGCPLGILQETYNACVPVRLAPGDMLILGTDGIVETRRGRERFGMARLTEFILQHRDRPVQEILDGVLAATTAFDSGHSPADDLTLMILRRQ